MSTKSGHYTIDEKSGKMVELSHIVVTTIETVDHPPHYNSGSIEAINAIEDWKLGFNLGNAVKYIARAKHKGKELEDLKKAAWYLARHIKSLEPK